jgi:CubicO group peptidase (beta-lactamase class C family)
VPGNYIGKDNLQAVLKKYKNLIMKKTTLIISILLLLIITCIIISCRLEPSSQYNHQPPENINDGLTVGTLDEVNIDSEMIEKAVDDINRGKYKDVHSMLIFKDGKLVFEEYFTGYTYQWDGPDYHGELVTWNRDMSHCVHSVTKSITSACIGIAVDKGLIQSVHQSIFDYLPEYRYLETDGKDKITIEHLLTMTSGLDWEEWGIPYYSKDNPIIGIWFSEKDPVTYILDRGMRAEPGTSFAYYGGNMILLGEILKNATDMNIDEFSAKYLFEPLGIDSFEWWLKFPNNVIEAAGGLKIKPRDMVKIGVTFLDNGVWDEKRIISGQWVVKCTTEYPGNSGIIIPGEDSGRTGYSYSWWTKQYSKSGKEINMFWALGWGGQKITVLPEVNTVVVFTGGAYTSEIKNFAILEKYIIPAIN